MKPKKRKILSRMGAAFLLGMSLFNFGAIWNKQKGGTLPRRSKNIRRQKQEEVDSEMQEVSNTAEEEASVVISQQIQEEQSQQQYQREQMTFSQKFIRYGAVGIWAISAMVIFSSVVFNQPFKFGRGMLSLLPGEPHTSVISLETENDNQYFLIGEQIKVHAKLNTGGDKISFIRMTMNYDPKILKLDKYHIDKEIFDVVEKKEMDEERGIISFSLKSLDNQVEMAGQSFANFDFIGTQEKDECELVVDQAESLVLKKGDNKVNNVLGKTMGASFRIYKKNTGQLTCIEVKDQKLVSQKDWEIFGNGLPTAEPTSNWTRVNDKMALLCVSGDGEEIKLLFSSPIPLNRVTLVQKNKSFSKDGAQFKDAWQKEGTYFSVVSFKIDKNIGEYRLEIEDQDGQKNVWP